MRLSTFKTVVAVAVLAVTTLACQGGDDAGGPDTAAQGREESGLRITALTVNHLAPGNHLRLDALEQQDVIRFDASEGAIDYSRIALAAGGQQVSMDRWLQDVARQRGVEAQSLGQGVMDVKLTSEGAFLEHIQGVSAQGVCQTCCTMGSCCKVLSECTYNPVTEQYTCICSFWGCCEDDPMEPI
ncbi:hypothetical protein LXT21_20165 [Myxococcus sp. K38C18041901]|uniref:hypothetical protein n=1 Tax=Myxococcus guangdongensis TaxID=2906760 RepID=UPI0020A801CD|nr:hypothetical protein [Myxococcus guangdongensis]MCP3061099.1 hypothetical protein [Myxococcus guangdongensis]